MKNSKLSHTVCVLLVSFFFICWYLYIVFFSTLQRVIKAKQNKDFIIFNNLVQSQMWLGILKHTLAHTHTRSFRKIYLIMPSLHEKFPATTKLCTVNFKYNQIGFRNTNGDFIEEPLLQQLRKLHLIFFWVLLNCARNCSFELF